MLTRGGKSALRLLAHQHARHVTVLPFCADFEEGSLAFRRRLRTASSAFAEAGVRLCVILGNVFGNLRDERAFVSKRLVELARPGDLVWLEVGLRPERLEQDPLFETTRPGHEESATEANRRLLIEGPVRRWAAATGRPLPHIDLRVSVHEGDDSCRVPGSINFVHDLIFREEGRACTMLYSRRYQLDELASWLERLGWAAEDRRTVTDSGGVPRVAHLLLRRV